MHERCLRWIEYHKKLGCNFFTEIDEEDRPWRLKEHHFIYPPGVHRDDKDAYAVCSVYEDKKGRCGITIHPAGFPMIEKHSILDVIADCIPDVSDIEEEIWVRERDKYVEWMRTWVGDDALKYKHILLE